MRRIFAALWVATLLVGGGNSSAAGMVKVKWVASVYSDSIGDGLSLPESVACNDTSFVVADSGNSRLVRYSYEGPAVTAEAEIAIPRSYPISVQVAPTGELYYLDGRDRRIVGVKAEGEKSGSLKPHGLPSSVDIVPKSFYIDRSGDFYILDIASGRVVILGPDGGYKRQISYPADAGFVTDLAVDRAGTVFIVDSVSAAVYSAVEGADKFSPLTKSLKRYMNFPTSLAVDASGVLYLVDRHGSGLGIVGPDGEFLGRTLGMGWKQSGLYFPTQICISPNGSLFIADRSNSRIQYFVVEGD